MSVVRVIYLLLAILGLVITGYYNVQFVAESGGSFSITEFMAAGASNSASASLSWDLAIACIAGLIWMFMESRRLGLRFFWLYVILAFTIAYAFAFPLFLFVRQGKIENFDGQETIAEPITK